MRKVIYQGVEVEVSDWAVCLASDSMGKVYEYSVEPDLVMCGRLGYWEVDENMHRYGIVGYGADIGKWQNSLTLINTLEGAVQ